MATDTSSRPLIAYRSIRLVTVRRCSQSALTQSCWHRFGANACSLIPLRGKISNVERLQLVDLAVTRSSHPETIKADVRYFLAGYRNCNDNRNILMHSMAMFVWFDPNAERCPVVSPKQPDAIAFQKSKRDDSHKIDIYRPTITELREVADALKSFETYGDDLYWHILKNYEPTIYESWGFPKGGQHSLPGRPALPKLLTPLPADIEGI